MGIAMNAEVSVPDKKRLRFEDYLPREGFAEIELTSEDFRAILNDAMPGVEWPDNVIDTVVDGLADHLARAKGQFGWSSFNTRRRDLRERLNLLRGSLKTAAHILASSGDLREKIDIDLLGFMTNVAVEADPGLTPALLNRKYASAHAQIKHILMHVEAAVAVLEKTSADGPARAAWYDLIVEGAVAAAQSLAIPLAIGGDRDHNPHDTPFVRLIMGLEALLPPKMQSQSLAACAKRIERSPAWRSTRLDKI
jgi:hypothetical protein